MPSVTYITRMRQRRRTAERRNPGGRTGLGCAGAFSLLLAVGGILLALGFSSLTQRLPSIETLPAWIEPPDGALLQPTRLYDQSGEHLVLTLENPVSAGRVYRCVPPSTTGDACFAQGLVNATVAASDPGFWFHPGFSLWGIRSGDHPTLAQRLVSDLLLQDEPPSLRRSLRERLLAAQVTARFGRQKILEWYLNSASYGRLAYGADAAARLYFGKSAADLDLAEAALLASLTAAPSLNPLDAPQAALERQKYVLRDMLRYRLAEPMAAAQAAQQKLVFRQDGNQVQALRITDLDPKVAPAFVQMALRQLYTQMPRHQVERGGLRVLTTLNYALQIELRCAAAAQLANLGTLAAPGDSPPGGCQAARLLPSLPAGDAAPVTGLRAEAVILEPSTGQIQAMTGEASPGLETSPLPAHTPGTLMTPFIYLTAFTRGLSPASLVWDIPPEQEQSAPGAAANFDGQYHGPLRLRTALANDYVWPADQVLTQVSAQNVLRTTQQFGILAPQNPINAALNTLSLFRPVNLVEVSQAFGILANRGTLAGHALENNLEAQPTASTRTPRLLPIQPATLLRVEDANGSVILDRSTPQTRPIISAQLAYLMTHILSDEAARWPSLGHPNPLEIGRPVAAKMGRTTSGADHWTVGYTPQRVVGVWLGKDAAPGEIPASSQARLQAATAGLWHALFQFASRDLPYQPWPVPDGLSNLKVCDPSGMLPTDACPNVVDEVFLAGNEPIQFDHLYRDIPINRQTVRLATVYTPSDLVDDRPYFIAPPEAAAWAQAAGFVTPPDVYDTIPLELPTWPDAQISSPAMLNIERGQVAITGTARGEDFAFYRLQIGAGLNPQQWYQLGQDSQQPVVSGKLGEWDTRQLNGLYALQLLVVDQDQNVKRTTTLLTIDNLPPEVTLLSPLPGEEIDPGQRKLIVLQAQVEDALGIASVEFYMDGESIATLVQPPFAISWQAKPGSHTLRVLAIDLAGNTNQAEVNFPVK